MKVITDLRRIRELTDSRFIDKIYPSAAKLEETLRLGRRLTIYWGADPTALDLHLDHSNALFILREFQKLGHKAIQKTPKNLKKQASKILDFNSKNNPAEVKFNSQWLKKLNLADILGLTANFTRAQLIERDMFERRIKEKKVIRVPELFYPLLQGYDSVAMGA